MSTTGPVVMRTLLTLALMLCGLITCPAPLHANMTDLWPTGSALQHLDQMMQSPQELTRVIGIDIPQRSFPVYDQATIEEMLREVRDKVILTVTAAGYPDITFWTYNLSVSPSGNISLGARWDGRVTASASISFMVTGRGDDEALARTIRTIGYTARITPYVFTKCGVPNPTFTDLQLR